MQRETEGPSWLAAHRDVIIAKRDGGAVAGALQAEAAIHDLLTAYAVFYDIGDLDRLLDLFADGATYTSYLGSYTGREELHENFAPLVQRYAGAAHLVTNTTIWVSSEETAKAASYVLAEIVTTDGVAYAFTGAYEDDLVCVAGRWLFARRMVWDGLAHTINPIPVQDRLPGGRDHEENA